MAFEVDAPISLPPAPVGATTPITSVPSEGRIVVVGATVEVVVLSTDPASSPLHAASNVAATATTAASADRRRLATGRV